MLAAALILGLAGSLHCAGMCGPLALALPRIGTDRRSFVAGRLVYNAGRLATYGALGVLFGGAGHVLALAGFQRWLSLTAGALILAGLLAGGASPSRAVTAWVIRIKALFRPLLGRRSFLALFALGLANGLLPCGLVYVAAAAAAAAGTVSGSAIYMLAFGLGTLPMMLAIPLLGRTVNPGRDLRRLVPLSIALVAVLLILRGLSLGIPYLSPAARAGGMQCPGCH